MISKTFNLLFALLLSNFIFSQSIEQNAIVIGKKIEINSKILDGQRSLNIYLPEDYSKKDTSYPVLYILDGQIHFLNGIAIQKSLQVPDIIPEMIIVGIENNYPQRTDLNYSNRATYYSYFKDELIPYINNSFRANGTQIVFGWELGAFFASHTLLHKTPLFDGTIVSNGGSTTPEAIDSFRNSLDASDKYLYITNTEKDIYTIDYSNDLVKTLESETLPKRLHWTYESFNDETHETLPYLALYHGLKFFYHNFKTLDFSSFEAYEDFGGIPSLNDYYQERGERFNLPTGIDDGTKNGLIWLAWNKDNFEYFKVFMSEFKSVLSTKRYDSAYWQNRLGQMYLKHGDFSSALPFFRKGINDYGDSKELAQLYYGLAQINTHLNKHSEAVSAINKSISIAKTKKDENLTTYQSYLESLLEKN